MTADTLLNEIISIEDNLNNIEVRYTPQEFRAVIERLMILRYNLSKLD